MRARQLIGVWLAIASALPTQVHAQVLRLGELNTQQIAALDRSRSVVILTGGIMEQHGPYLPSFSDGYVNEWIAQRLAEAIVARPGWTAALFPTIPLGSGGANELGSKHTFPGTYAVRSGTLRAVFMDLADEFGGQGFRWIFVVHAHGAPSHSRALDQAGDYFRDTYGGRMVHLLGLSLPNDGIRGDAGDTAMTEGERREDGFSVHAGAWETSGLLFLRPDLVGPIQQAEPHTAQNWDDIVRVARQPGWPGYFGSPRVATAARGARSYGGSAKRIIDFALTILDGADERQVPRASALAVPASVKAVHAEALSREQALEKRQQAWLQAHLVP